MNHLRSLAHRLAIRLGVVNWLWADDGRYRKMADDLGLVCNRRGIPADGWVPESVLREIGFTDADLTEMRGWIDGLDDAEYARIVCLASEHKIKSDADAP